MSFDYDKIPSGYYANLEPHGARARWHEEKFRWVETQLRDGGLKEGVLDVGCGPGVFLSRLKSQANLYGVDIATKQLEVAESFVPAARFATSVDDFTSDALKISHVVCIELIEHLSIEEISQLLSRVERIATTRRSSGKPTRLIITTPNYRSLWPVLEVVVDRVTGMDYRRQHITHFNAIKLKRLLEEVFASRNPVTKISAETFQCVKWLFPRFNWLDERLARGGFGSLIGCVVDFEVETFASSVRV